jgi:hypothetical protein
MPAPELLEAINRNSLAVFLLVRFTPFPVRVYVYADGSDVPRRGYSGVGGTALQANVATGIVNLWMQTMYASDGRAMGVLGVYAFGVCAFSWAVRGLQVWKL